MAEATFEQLPLGEHEFELMRWSSNKPVGVLLPGAAGGIRGYDEIGASLASLGLSLAGMNPRGCGGSTGPLQEITAHELVQDVIDVVSTVASVPALLVGHAGEGEANSGTLRNARTLRPSAPQCLRRQLAEQLTIAHCESAELPLPMPDQDIGDGFAVGIHRTQRAMHRMKPSQL